MQVFRTEIKNPKNLLLRLYVPGMLQYGSLFLKNPLTLQKNAVNVVLIHLVVW